MKGRKKMEAMEGVSLSELVEMGQMGEFDHLADVMSKPIVTEGPKVFVKPVDPAWTKED